MTTRLLLIRHGETTWNAMAKMQGQANSPLSEQGITQAQGMKDHLASQTFLSVTASDLQRTRDTAKHAGFAQPVTDSLWREIDVGEWSGRMYADLKVTYPREIKAWKLAEFTPPGAESWQSFVERIEQAIATLPVGEDGTHLVFSHGLVVKAAYCIFSGKHHTEVPPITNCSMSEFDLSAFAQNGAGSQAVLRFNHTLHSASAMAYL